jgi:chromosome segregation ATPase
MHRFSLLISSTLTGLLLAVPLRAEAPPLRLLQEEMQRTVAERDAARRRLLQLQADTEPQVKALGEERAALQARLEELNRSLMETQAAAAVSSAALRRAEAELSLRNQRVDDLRREQLVNREVYTRLLRQMQTLNQRTNEGTPADATATDAQRQSLEMQRQILLEDIARKEAETQKALADQKAIEAERDQFKSLNETLAEELRTSRRAESFANAKVAALENRMGILREELEEQYRIRSELEQEREGLQKKLTEAEARAKEEQNQSKELARDNRRLQDQLRDQDEARKKLEKQTEELRKEVENARAAGVRGGELDSVKAVLSDMETERLRMQQEMAQQRESVDTLTTQLNEEQTRGRAQLVALQAELNQRVRELATAQASIEQLTLRAARVRGLESERQALLARRDKSQQDMRVLADHIHELRAQISEGRRTKVELDTTREEAAQLRRTLEESQRKEEALRQTRAAMEAEMAELRRRIRHLEQKP